MDFRGFVVNDHEKVARMMIEHPNPIWREGFGKANPEEELAAVLHYAEKGFPDGGKSLTIQAPVIKGLVYEALMKIAEDMERRGLLDIDRDILGYVYIGKPGHVKDGMRLTNRRKPELIADEEQHRAVGRLLGYNPDAIEKFIRRTRRNAERARRQA